MNPKINDRYLEAQSFVAALQKKVPLVSAVLDDWRGGVRVIYGPSACTGDCPHCPLFQVVGIDSTPVDTQRLITSLVSPSPDDGEIFRHQQPYLNCKTLTQYAECFVDWLIKKCPHEKDVFEELEFIRDFRILYLANAQDLASEERWIKKQIIFWGEQQFRDSDPQKWKWIKGTAQAFQIIP